MQQMASEVFLPIAVLMIVFTAGTIIPIGITWLQSRTKMRAIEVLKTYAEKGQEPPASVLDAVNRMNSPFPQGAQPAPKPMREQSRGEHLMHVAGSVGLALGAGAVIWWRAPLEHEHPGWLLITAVFVAIFFTAAAAARLVGAITADDGKR